MLYGFACVQNAVVAILGLPTLLLISDEPRELLVGFVIVAIAFAGLFSLIVVIAGGGRVPSVLGPAPAGASVESPRVTFLRLARSMSALMALLILFVLVPGEEGDSLAVGLPAAAALTFGVMYLRASGWERRRGDSILIEPGPTWRPARYVRQSGR